MTRGRAVLWVIVGAACCAMVGLLWTFIRPVNAGGEALGGYPERISKPHVERTLPTRPGPLAAIVEDNDFGNVRYHGVSEFGQVWALPRSFRSPTLSPDGRHLLAMAGAVDPRLTVLDLATGQRLRFEEIGSDSRGPADGAPAAYRTNGSGAVWSPDGLRIAVTTAHDRSRKVPVWLDLAEEKVHELEIRGLAAGWQSSDEVVVLESRKRKGEPRTVVARVVNVRGGSTKSLALSASVPWRWSPSQASVSPGGRLLVSNDRLFESFDLASGERLETREVEDATSCEISWWGEDPIIGTKVYGTPARSMLIRAEKPPQSLVAVHPKFQSNCVTWAAAAINGQERDGLWGTNSARWTWYWREALVFDLLLVVVALGIALRTRNRQAGGFDEPGTSDPPA